MSAAYSIEQFDLSVARDRMPIPSTVGANVATVYCRKLPSPASLHYGNNQAWELEQGKDYRPCPAEHDGISLSNPVGAGTLVLVITIDGASVEVGSAGSASLPPGFMAAQQIPPTAPAAPYHHFALMRNPVNSKTLITLRRCAVCISTAIVAKGQIAGGGIGTLEAGAVASTTILVQKTDRRLGAANVADFFTDPGNSTNGVGPATFSKAGVGVGTVELIGLTEPPISLLPGDVYQIDEQDSTTGTILVMYEYDQTAL